MRNSLVKTAGHLIQKEFDTYGEKKAHVKLGPYLVLIGVFQVYLISSLRAGRKNLKENSDEKTPGGFSALELIKLAAATHKLTRIITHDWVTASIRAPFTRYKENAGNGEFSEESRGGPVRQAIGDLLTCPYCAGPWVATALIGIVALRPYEGRRLLDVFSAVAVSDFLHLGFEKITK